MKYVDSKLGGNFEEIVAVSQKTALVDFWAPWCGPCRTVGPIVEEIAEEREDICVGKVNVDENHELAARFGVMSIPTLIVFKDGEEAARLVGSKPKSVIVELLD